MQNTHFEMTDYANRIEKYKSEVLDIFSKIRNDEAVADLSSKLNAIDESEKIKIAFIGQYSAGKSTLISALTNNDDIKIDADIATSEVSGYSWGNVTLVDTPGLYTENQEHSNITKNEIAQSDLLVYCITSDLFNQYTLEDFKKLAFEEKYAEKMFLVVNKMSKEDGDYDELVANYTETINKSLYPHNIGEFAHVFVDAKDYKDGIKENNEELIKFSRFEVLIKELNDFIRVKGQLGKFDTPISIVKQSIDNVVDDLLDNDDNKKYKALLSRIENKVIDLKKHIQREANAIIKDNLKAIVDKGYEVSRQIGIPGFEFSEEQVNELIELCCNKANAKIEELYEQGYNKLASEIEDVIKSPVGQAFFDAVDGCFTGDKKLFEGKKVKLNRMQVMQINNFLEKAVGKVAQMGAKEGIELQGLFLHASEAAESQLHNIVLNVGHALGVKFKPWQAVNIAKNVGNAAKVAGVALQGVGIILDAAGAVEDEKQVKQLEQKQLECRQSFKNIADDLEGLYQVELENMFKVYDEVTKDLHTNQEAIDKLMKEENKYYKRLEEIRASLTRIQSEIYVQPTA